MRDIIKRFLFSKGLFGGTFWSFIGLVANSIFVFFYLSLVGKKAGPEILGMVGVFYSFYMFISFLFGSGFRDYVVRKISKYAAKNEYKKVKNLVDEAVSYLIFVLILNIFLFLIFNWLILKKLFNGNYFLFFSSFLCFFLLTFGIVGRGFVVGKKIFSAFGILFFLRGFLLFFSGLFFYIKGLKDLKFYIYPFIIAEFSNFILYAFYLIYLKRGIFFKINFNLPLNEIFSMSFSNSVLNSFFTLPLILLKIKNVSENLIGNFTAEISAFRGLRVFFASFFVPAYPAISSSYYKGDKKNFRKIIYLSFSLIFFFVAIFTFFIVLWGQSFLYIFFPKKDFIFYKKEFLLLSVSLLFHLITRFFTRVFFGSERHNFVWKVLFLWVLILVIPYLLIKTKNEINLILIFLIISTLISSLIFAYLFLKIFNSKGSIPSKSEIVEE